MAEILIDIREIMKMLPHRYPFLLVDRVIDYVDGESLTAIKNVTYNEQFFTGHFPALPTMPGVLMLEALAQVSGLLAVKKSGMSADHGLILYFAGIDDARFKRPVVPGDQLTMTSVFEKQKRDLWMFSARAMVGSELACSAKLMCALKNTAPKEG